MTKSVLNFWLDVLLFALFVTWFWATLVMRFVFPPATVAAGWTIWGATYDQWSDFQFGAVCLFALAVLIHVMLHWSWVCGIITQKMMRRKSGKKEAVVRRAAHTDWRWPPDAGPSSYGYWFCCCSDDDCLALVRALLTMDAAAFDQSWDADKANSTREGEAAGNDHTPRG